LAAVVLVVAGLLFRSFDRLSRVEPGIELSNRVTFRVAPDWRTMPQREEAWALYTQLFARLSATPEVTDVAAVNRLPLTGSWWTTEYRPEGQSVEKGREPIAEFRVVAGPYFKTLGIPLLRGRPLGDDDREDSERVIVVSRTFAKHAWPASDPIGRRVTFDPGESRAPWYTVVGVVGDVHSAGLADAAEALAYVPFAQARFGHFGDWGMDVVVHSQRPIAEVLASATRALQSLAPTLPVFDARTLHALVGRDLARRRLLMLLLGAFALCGVLLSGLGLYGVVSYSVSQRRAEIGVRMALGADRGALVRSVLVRGVALAGMGVAIGLAAALATSRLLAGLLFGIPALDPVTFIVVPQVLLAVAVVASMVPAYRSTRVDPAETLRAS
jgi:putative ABC transport system permease protein